MSQTFWEFFLGGDVRCTLSYWFGKGVQKGQNGLLQRPRWCCKVPLGCYWGPGGDRVEESGEGREWRGSGGQGCHHLLPGRRRGDGSGSQFRWETTGLPPTEDRRNSLLPPSKTQTSTSINFFIVTSHFEPSSTCIQPPLIENSFVVCKKWQNLLG